MWRFRPWTSVANLSRSWPGCARASHTRKGKAAWRVAGPRKALVGRNEKVRRGGEADADP
eukprot:751957-Hanusia_phi.AAC.4